MAASTEQRFPPLLGDEQGHYRVHIVGNSGVGKSTTAKRLAAILKVPFISMDTLMWEPGWKPTGPDEFRAKLRAALDQPACENGWVVDGNYTKLGGLLAYDESTDVVWLDPPLALYLPRLIFRTFLRLLRVEPPCSPGCLEQPTEVFFLKSSIIWWCLSHHWYIRKRTTVRMGEIGLGVGTDVERRRMRRLGGWGSELRKWLKNVEDMMRGEGAL